MSRMVVTADSNRPDLPDLPPHVTRALQQEFNEDFGNSDVSSEVSDDSETSSDPWHGYETRLSSPPQPTSPVAGRYLRPQPLNLPLTNTPIDAYPLSPHSRAPKSGILLNSGYQEKRPGAQVTLNYPTESDEEDITTQRWSMRSRRRYSSIVDKKKVKHRPAMEPGIDIRNTEVILKTKGSVVTIIDYSSEKVESSHIEIYPYSESSTTEIAHSELARKLANRPKSSRVRWINVSGLSWEVIYAISHHFNLHKLAVEDMVDIPQRTKVDEYPTHTFCCLPLHRLVPTQSPAMPKVKDPSCWDLISNLFGPSSETPESPNPMRTKEPTLSVSDSLSDRLTSTKMRSIYQWNNPVQTTASAYLESRRPLAHSQKKVGVEQVSLFLTNQNTVISFFERSSQDIEIPIIKRLQEFSTILRESSDASILLQAIIDGIVDLVHPIVKEYRARLDKLEVDALLNPSMEHTRDLHLIHAELTTLRYNIAPITSLVNSLRDHSEKREEDTTPFTDSTGTMSWESSCKVSKYASVYLADVADHALSYTQDLDIMRNSARGMIDLIFNTISIQSSDAVKLLSLVTVVFLPLSFLTGYFGMNFTEFDSLNHGVGYYWAIAVPCAVTMSAFLMYPWARDNLRKVNQIVQAGQKEYKTRRRKQTKRASRAYTQHTHQV